MKKKKEKEKIIREYETQTDGTALYTSLLLSFKRRKVYATYYYTVARCCFLLPFFPQPSN